MSKATSNSVSNAASDTVLHPRLMPLALTDLSPAGIEIFHDYDLIEGHRMTQIPVTQHLLSGLTFTECELVGFHGAKVNLKGTRFSEVRAEAWDMPAVEAHRGAMRRVEMDSSRLGAFEIYDSALTEVVFSNCKLGWINLRASKLRDIHFINCTIDELDLSDASAERVNFTDCRASVLTLHNTSLSHVDLRGLELGQINGLEGLRGVTISELQLTQMAPLLAHHLGILVAD